MKDGSLLIPLQKLNIIALLMTNVAVPTARLLYQIIERMVYQKENAMNLMFHALVVLLQCSIIALHLSGWVRLKTLGIFSSQVACFAFLTLGNFVEPHLNSLWSLASFCITYFVQANLIESITFRQLCYAKPLSEVIVFGLASGTLQMKSINEGLCIIVVLVFGSFGIYSTSTIEELREKALNAFKEAEQQLSLIISNIPVGLFVLNKNGKVMLANDTCLYKLEITEASEIVGRLENIKCKNGAIFQGESLTEALFDYIESNMTEVVNFGQTLHNDRNFVWSGQKVNWKSQTAVVVVIKDISDVLKLERAQVESHFKNILLRSVSHELKTPTNGIIHSVQAVAQEESLSPFAREKLAIAEVSCKHLMFLISDLLDYSQLISAQFSLKLANFDLRVVLSECVELIQLIADKKKIRLVKHFDPRLPEEVTTDQSRLNQVLLNLLSNAVKFTKKRGKIEVRAELTEDNQMKVSVKDNGVGIAQVDMDKLFKAFACLEASESINLQGTGLGLHISNMLALQLGGIPIEVKSKIGAGSSFTFKVKINKGEPMPLYTYTLTSYSVEDFAEAQPIYNFKLKSKKAPWVLVVDDSPFNRSIIVDILASDGIACAEASNGKEAYERVIQRAKTHKPFKVIVMDFEMPEMNGPTACKAIFATLRELVLSEPVVIAHTAYSSSEDIALCSEAGMIGFLPKPSSRETVVSTVCKYLI